MTEKEFRWRLRSELVEAKGINDFTTTDPFVGIYFERLFDIVRKIRGEEISELL